MPKKTDDIIEELSPLERRVLIVLRDVKKLSPEEIARKGSFKELVEVMNAASWLQSKRLVTVKESLMRFYTLAKKQYASKLLPERRALKELRKFRTSDLDNFKKNSKLTDKEFKIALGWMKRKGWAQISKEHDRSIIQITDKGLDSAVDKGADELLLQRIGLDELSEDGLSDQEKNAVKLLKTRQEIIHEREAVQREVELTELGAEVAQNVVEIKEEVSQLTPEHLQSDRWRNLSFRKYDVNAFAPKVTGGGKHILAEYRERVASLFTSMGFIEVEYGIIVPSFWNMDVLFVPQDHPARELWDTFYLDLENDESLEMRFMQKVKDVHESGGNTESEGWRYEWSENEARKMVLRSHTTPNTIRYLSEHPDKPVKVFTIGKCFRKDAWTYKHSPEFYQLEGIIMEEGAGLSMLMGILKEFYSRLGFERIEFKPSYFAFTEPSLEVLAEFKNDTIELAGAGIFRPEITEPWGIKWPVLAWGMGLERLVMVLEDIKDIREFYQNDLDQLRSRGLF
jgi:phenylalanyl-tRNA synthetase alpha chain